MKRRDRITCPLCGAGYDEREGLRCRGGCPLEESCQLLRCPRCSYEVPAPTRLTRWVARLLHQAEADT